MLVSVAVPVTVVAGAGSPASCTGDFGGRTGVGPTGRGTVSGKIFEPQIQKHPQFDGGVEVVVPSMVSRSIGAAHCVHAYEHPAWNVKHTC